MTEEEVQRLLEQTRQGENEATEMLLRESRQQVLGMCREMVVRSPDLNADDVFQEAFVKLYSGVDALP